MVPLHAESRPIEIILLSLIAFTLLFRDRLAIISCPHVLRFAPTEWFCHEVRRRHMESYALVHTLPSPVVQVLTKLALTTAPVLVFGQHVLRGIPFTTSHL